MTVVTFLSDYGLADDFVGIVHGVIARIAPDARIIDLGHGVPLGAVGYGAVRLARALPFMPSGAHLAVVDPGVGGSRRAIALRTAQEDRFLVGPDNGLLTAAAARFGGVAEAVEISNSPWRLEPVSATFHGRDVFAPVAARLAAGAPLGAAGTALDPAEVVPTPMSRPRHEDGALVTHVVGTDGFGNVELDADELPAPLGAEVVVSIAGERHSATVARTFADVAPEAPLLYRSAGGAIVLALREGSAARTFALTPGDEVGIAPA